MSSLSNVEMLISAKPKDLGGGFIVRRSLPNMKRRMIGPFIFFDHMGPVDLQVGNGMDVRPHPHIGLSTLTYLFKGEIVHRDTLGFEQEIRPGAVNWMTAGSGVAHSERSSQTARQREQQIHGLQIWIALPKEAEEVKSSFHHHGEKDIPTLRYEGADIRVVAGEFEKLKSPVATYSDLVYLDLKLFRNQPLSLPHNGMDLGIYVVEGAVKVGDTVVQAGDMAALSKAQEIRIEPLEDTQAMLLGGTPFAEDRFIWWNFVSSSQERIEKAKQDWREQNFGKIRGETEFIPLPEK